MNSWRDLANMVPGIPAEGLLDTPSASTSLSHVQKVLLDQALSANQGTSDGKNSEWDRSNYRFGDVALRPIAPSDYQQLYVAATNPVSSFRWRFRGRTLSPAEFDAQLFADSIMQFAVARTSGQLIGIVMGYDDNPIGRTCFFGFERAIPKGDGEMILGAALAIDYLFQTFNFRALFIDVPEYNNDLVRGLGPDFFEPSGVLREYYFHGDRYWDRYVYRLSSERWRIFAGSWAG